MKYSSQNKHRQLTLDIFRSSFDSLDKHNRWVILGDTLPWQELEKIYNSRLHNEVKGAGNKPARMMIGALIVKHKLNLSDEETVEIIRENPYMQYMCGLPELTDSPLFDPSLLVTVRKRITIDDINSMTEKLLAEECRLKAERSKESKKPHTDGQDIVTGKGCDDGIPTDSFAKEFTDSQGRTHKGTVKVDATCANAEVRYPVDVDIIRDGCKVVDRYIGRICKALGIKKMRTSYSESRRVYLNLVKQKKKGRKLILFTRKFMLNCLNKDLERIISLFLDHKGSREYLKKHEQRILGTVFDMYSQQEEMVRTGAKTCANRIVSIFQPHIRPIKRGKAKAETEFGAKIGVSIYEEYTFIDHFSWDAYNECSDMDIHIEKFQKRFNCLPSTLLGDKIYMNKTNRATLKEKEIKTYSKPLGRPPKKDRPPEFYKNMVKAIGERNEVECSFGTGKRVYRADNIRAKLPKTAECWTGMCYFVKNVMKFLRELCLRISGWNVMTNVTGKILYINVKFTLSQVSAKY